MQSKAKPAGVPPSAADSTVDTRPTLLTAAAVEGALRKRSAAPAAVPKDGNHGVSRKRYYTVTMG